MHLSGMSGNGAVYWWCLKFHSNTMHAESDWKKFRAMVPKLRERYLGKCNARIAALLTDPAKNETECFWDAMETMEKEAKLLRHCLDGHSRSKMWLFIISMIRSGMLDQGDLTEFSAELRDSVSRAFDEIAR